MTERHLITTRYNNKTAMENNRFRKENNDVKCIYSNDTVISKIPANSMLFVLEMNNEINKIIGIGMINTGNFCDPLYNDPKYKLYENLKFNTFVYIGNRRIDRTDMTETEERIMCVMDVLCFTGKRHQKRIRGLSLFPKNMLDNCNKIINLIDSIDNMFTCREKK